LLYIFQIPAINQTVNPQSLQNFTEFHRILAQFVSMLDPGFLLEIRLSEIVWVGGVAIRQGRW